MLPKKFFASVDYSLLAERTAYSAFNMIPGSFASRAVHAKVFINGVYDGVYILVEEVDDEFTENRFSTDDNFGKVISVYFFVFSFFLHLSLLVSQGALYKDIFPKYPYATAYTSSLKEGPNEGNFSTFTNLASLQALYCHCCRCVHG